MNAKMKYKSKANTRIYVILAIVPQ